MLFSNTSKDTNTSIAILKLWYHECQRVFQDRMGNKQNEDLFNKLVLESLKEHGGIMWKNENLIENTTMFGDYARLGGYGHDRPYQEIPEQKTLSTLFDNYLKSYAMTAINPMKLVFFQDAINHVSRICRAIRMESGHLLLLGIGGMGKRSLTRFAAYLSSYNIFEITVSKGYGPAEFREDLKKLLRMTGVQSNLAFLSSLLPSI